MTTPIRFPRPPSDRGQGRKPKPADERLVGGSVRFKRAHWAKLALLGGVDWLRERIERATVPATNGRKRSRAS